MFLISSLVYTEYEFWELIDTVDFVFAFWINCKLIDFGRQLWTINGGRILITV
jgi:hypothetical protein